MSQTIVNITFPLIQSAIDDVLSRYESQPLHRSQLTTQDFKDKLATFVMRRVPLRYITLEGNTACALTPTPSCYSSDQQQAIQNLIHQGIQELLTPDLHAAPATTGAGLCSVEPSSWFG
jgi:hypothetical protein